jgi:hypothetical protein
LRLVHGHEWRWEDAMTKILRLLTAAGVVLLGLTIGVGQVSAQTLDRILKEKKYGLPQK